MQPGHTGRTPCVYGLLSRGASLWKVISRSLSPAWQAQRGTLAEERRTWPLPLTPPPLAGWQPLGGPRAYQLWPPCMSSGPLPVSGPPCELTREPENVTNIVAARGGGHRWSTGEFQGWEAILCDTVLWTRAVTRVSKCVERVTPGIGPNAHWALVSPACQPGPSAVTYMPTSARCRLHTVCSVFCKP